ncbi:MAG: 50S ribosomal protein L21 [Actinomycetota bacterium]|jgi:large subunit ribosomal protein L21|nr:50S ribosomal protein L21 [Rubrobacteraceae bacterium]MBA3635856.1 50S ribosomal protein L21 [Rubrobacteraceae bacterium]MDQ3184574.1 50S ribosomal protein L21 [Actinomycetota bacterium]MDQ3496855.1 50S ribosomal protein L21 [Actinomycetota bacterium]
MFAVVKSGGKQYRVEEGQELVVDRLDGEVGDTVELPVGFSVDEGGFDLGEKNARVEILEHLRGDKIYVYKYKPKKDYRKKTGHRQELTRVRVLEVSDGS